ncbi:MAG: heavy-metal-associated domain-containing protein [Eubacteriales bacterium]|nr:heavy-metal-associated domain-containing protein [Eubacteriales bacterium]
MSKNSAYFSVTSLRGAHDVKRIKRELDRKCNGVLSVAVGQNGNLVSVDFDDTGVTPQMLRNCLTDMGYTVNSARMEYFN